MSSGLKSAMLRTDQIKAIHAKKGNGKSSPKFSDIKIPDCKLSDIKVPGTKKKSENIGRFSDMPGLESSMGMEDLKMPADYSMKRRLK